MVDYAYGEADPPPVLIRAFDYKAWGVNVYDLPPGEVRAVSSAWNTYALISEYRSAAGRGKATDWTEANPARWEQVSKLIADRMQRKRNG